MEMCECGHLKERHHNHVAFCYDCKCTEFESTEILNFRQFKHRLQLAIDSTCSCGGMGTNDPGVCVACKIWHEVIG
jgi:hypothetical protein